MQIRGAFPPQEKMRELSVWWPFHIEVTSFYLAFSGMFMSKTLVFSMKVSLVLQKLQKLLNNANSIFLSLLKLLFF